MIHYKTIREIELMREGGAKLQEVVKKLLATIKAGLTTKQIDSRAEDLIRQAGGKPSFKKVNNYSWTTCLPINEQVVHTPPSNRILKDGDVLTLDIGMYYQGFHTDYAKTISVGKKTDEKTRSFLETGWKALYGAIEWAKPRNRLGHISKIIEKEISEAGFFILKELTGHGIGHKLHEEPFVFGFLDREIYETLEIKPGLTIAIEVIYSRGTEHIVKEKGSRWSIATADSSLSACFEHTVAITNKGAEILT